MDKIDREVMRAIESAIRMRLNEIGSVIDGKAREAILKEKIYDKGNYWNNTTYKLKGNLAKGYILQFGSNVKYEPFILGGKEPSWTPFAPIKAWVERKGLSWTDKKTNKVLNVEQIAWMIIRAIKRRGIPARNVYDEIIRNREAWIYKRLQTIEVN